MRLIRKRNRGFTLIELAIVVVIICILSSLSIWQAQDMLPRLRTKGAAQTFSKWVDRCRSLAVRTNRECRITLLSFDASPTLLATANAGSYSITLGNANRNSTTWDLLPIVNEETGEIGMVDLAPGSRDYQRYVSIDNWGTNIGGPYNTTQDSLVFSPRGNLINPPTDFNSQGFIEVVFVNKLARSEGRNEDFVVMVARSGMVRLDNYVGRRYDTIFAGTAIDASSTN
ncbi:MAG: pilus assembly FimT family protein [Myxococcota bacterium]